jgi:hypothetical protein
MRVYDGLMRGVLSSFRTSARLLLISLSFLGLAVGPLASRCLSASFHTKASVYGDEASFVVAEEADQDLAASDIGFEFLDQVTDRIETERASADLLSFASNAEWVELPSIPPVPVFHLDLPPPYSA